MCLHMSLQITISGILPKTPCKKRFLSPVCLAVCVFRLFPCENPTPHSLQLNGFFQVCKLVCCYGLSLLKNPAQHSLQMHCFPPVCFWIWHLSWLFLEILTKHSLQSNVLPYGSSDDIPVQILDHTRFSWMAFLQYLFSYVASGNHLLQILLHIPCR